MLECFDTATAGHMPGTSALFSALPCTGVALPFTVPQDVVRKRDSAHATRADCPASLGRSECVGNKIAVAPVESTGDPESDQEAARDKQTQVEGTYAKKPFIDIVRARPRPAVHTAPGILYGQIGTGTPLIGRDMRLHTDGQGAERGGQRTWTWAWGVSKVHYNSLGVWSRSPRPRPMRGTSFTHPGERDTKE